ncbi:hypothetical protein [Actinoplanes sp. L3-i22]|uniref:hypothetical protein n=1 Tax=Actinoplanes sp. L3-i22 TaxID=2836373 RepID=UPI001C796563|nr:hypothetical protein [Actinoplanes sp. L3-i22]BCY11092.1 hypothetical protein L3i22_061800 [Actinoplanes sp. L3-i22]
MSSYVNLPDGPQAAAQVGERLKAAAESFQQRSAALLSRIQGLDGGTPWGADKAGKAFEQQYHKPMGEQGTLAHALQDRLATAGKVLDEVGTNVVTAMTNYDVADQTGGTDIAGVM